MKTKTIKAKLGGDPFSAVGPKAKEEDIYMCEACNQGLHEECTGESKWTGGCNCEPCTFD